MGPMSLNPFEVREVLQDIYDLNINELTRLNPFEVREVLQGKIWPRQLNKIVSIPLKSGRCCKGFKIKGVSTLYVSIPLKSGRCCKVVTLSAASKSKVSIPLKSGRCCKGALQNYLF